MPTPFVVNPTSFPVARFNSLATILNLIFPNLLIGAAILFFVMLVFAAFQYMASDGNPEKLKKAQQIMITSGIGFILVLSSYFLVRLIGSLFGTPGLPF